MEKKEKNMEKENGNGFARCMEALCEVCNGSTAIPLAVLEKSGVKPMEVVSMAKTMKGSAAAMMTECADRLQCKPRAGNVECWMDMLRKVSDGGRKPVIAHGVARINGESRRVAVAVGKTSVSDVASRYPKAEVLRCASPKKFEALCKGRGKGVIISDIYSFEYAKQE